MKCPKCEAMLTSFRAEVIDASLPPGYNFTSMKVVGVTCPHCYTILGTTIEPIALRTDVAKAVVKLLGK